MYVLIASFNLHTSQLFSILFRKSTTSVAQLYLLTLVFGVGHSFSLTFAALYDSIVNGLFSFLRSHVLRTRVAYCLVGAADSQFVFCHFVNFN